MIHPKIGNEVPYSQVGPAIVLADDEECTESKSESNITCKNELGIFSLIQGASRIEVIDSSSNTVLLSFTTTLLLALMEVMSRNVQGDVKNPAEQLLANEMDSGHYWSFLGKF